MELDALDTILTQNKVTSQQINTITQHLGKLQASAINTQDASYDMSDGFSQGEHFDYSQFPSEQNSKKTLIVSCKKLELQLEIWRFKWVSIEAQVSEELVEKEALEEAQDKVEHAPKRHMNKPNLVDVEQ
ncbi:hypothetical protein AHAS_Ahas16G0239400 [Arachis hypogaea]